MILPDFIEFEPFNRLRQLMGATELGKFEFFDPQLHLTAEELHILEVDGLAVPLDGVRALSDLTLAYKNSRVLMYPLDHDSSSVYHLANCEILKQARKCNANALWLTAKFSSHLPGDRSARVCSACLQALHYKSFDSVRSRHRDYSQRVQDSFSLADFFKSYPCYPIKEKAPECIF